MSSLGEHITYIHIMCSATAINKLYINLYRRSDGVYSCVDSQCNISDVYTCAAVIIGILFISQTVYVYRAIVRVRDIGVVQTYSVDLWACNSRQPRQRVRFFSHPSPRTLYILYRVYKFCPDSKLKYDPFICMHVTKDEITVGIYIVFVYNIHKYNIMRCYFLSTLSI